MNDSEIVSELRDFAPRYQHARVVNNVEITVEMLFVGPSREDFVSIRTPNP